MYYRILIAFVFIGLHSCAWGQGFDESTALAEVESLFVARKTLEARAFIDGVVPDTVDNSPFELELLRIKARCLEEEQMLTPSLVLINHVIREAKKAGLHAILAESYLQKALIHEKEADFDKCLIFLEEARDVIVPNPDLAYIYPDYCIRTASYYRFKGERDSIAYYAIEGLHYGAIHLDFESVRSGYYFQGKILNSQELIVGLLPDLSLAATNFYQDGNHHLAGRVYELFCDAYQRIEQPQNAIFYADSAIEAFSHTAIPVHSKPYTEKARAFQMLGQLDSALFYTDKSYQIAADEAAIESADQLADMAEDYEDLKQKQEYDHQLDVNSNQRSIMILLTVFLAIVGFISVLLLLSRRKLQSKQKLISMQAQALQKSLDEKEVLMAELQHRVKNNLQMVIGLLGLQRNSPQQKTTDEILLESQNRVRTMSILYEKLLSTDEYDGVDAASFFGEISSLMNQSYQIPDRNVEIHIDAGDHMVTTKNAMPLGLIAVEMLSNSFKHAFKDQDSGEITIQFVDSDDPAFSNVLIYKDNGKCEAIPDFKKSKGVGMEIINGLVSQLKGKLNPSNSGGLELRIYF